MKRKKRNDFLGIPPLNSRGFAIHNLLVVRPVDSCTYDIINFSVLELIKNGHSVIIRNMSKNK